MGVFCVERTGLPLFGTSNRLWSLLGDVLTALQAEQAALAWTRDGYVPSWLARSWGDTLFRDLGEVVLVCRPLPGHGNELQPVGTYRRGSPAASSWTRAGEHLSVYDTPVAPVLLAFAQACTASSGFSVTTLRPPAPGSSRSPAAVHRLLVRSGMLRLPAPRSGRTRRGPVGPATNPREARR
ncbi:MAG: hypothetical protein JWM64_2109 [Frankiales bacterium]|nr:hypothetical protein [Frankiales bacterium]